MQRLLLGDVLAFVDALAQVPRDQQPDFGRQLLRQAEVAHDHRMGQGAAHPLWGAGSVMAVARQAHVGVRVDWHHIPTLEAAALGCQLLAEHLKSVGSHTSHRGS